MERIITDEFIAYKSGFLDGKQSFYLQLLKNVSTFFKEQEETENWYSKGYNDGFEYCLYLYLNNNKPDLESLQKMFDKKMIEESFFKKVSEYNESNDSKVVVGKFKM